jgi:hypothetical protein
MHVFKERALVRRVFGPVSHLALVHMGPQGKLEGTRNKPAEKFSYTAAADVFVFHIYTIIYSIFIRLFLILYICE